MPATSPLHPLPTDATLTVTRAAQVLGVHSNTVRAWSEAGRLRYYRINKRGDRRYRLSDLHRFLSAAVSGPAPDADSSGRSARTHRGLARRDRQSPTEGLDGSGDVASTVKALTALGRLTSGVAGATADPEVLLGSAARILREGSSFSHVSAWRLAGGRLEPVAVSGSIGLRPSSVPANGGLFAMALKSPGQVIDDDRTAGGLDRSIPGVAGRRVACTIPGSSGPWGVLVAITPDEIAQREASRVLLGGAADMLGSVLRSAVSASKADRRLHWAEALGRVAGDISSQLDPDDLLARLLDHAIAMFDADRAAVFLFKADESRHTIASRGLSQTYLTSLEPGDLGGLTSAAVKTRRPVFAMGYRDDPRAADVRASVVQEGYDTICIAPLMGDGGEPIGSVNVYHDRQHAWDSDELDAFAALGAQAGDALRRARMYAQLTTWAAQLQSIQQLGPRLNRLSEVAEIGTAIANELRQLIDYQNVRVYRKYGDDLVPVAMLGQVGEYLVHTLDQLRTKVGAGITGWVAEHGVAEILNDAAADPRAESIPGTEDDLDESMLLAPMLFEDQVLGVLVLSKLGLDQFTDDDLRLLVIYASFAAQAMAHADATQSLRRQVQSRRDLLAITESMLGTLDTTSVLETVGDRLGELVGSDNVWIELLDDASGTLNPVMVKGADADSYWEPTLLGEVSLATWVMEHNEAALVADQFDDERVFALPTGPAHGGLICVPLRDRGGPVGILSIERLGEGRSFSEEEFELVQLFAAHVSIAVQNARAHGEIARQAETDDLTGLRNHRGFRRVLAEAVVGGHAFSLLMLDLDHFKQVNDTFGHEAGNNFLQGMAGSIAKASRDTDSAFRYGGDEFVVILAGTDADHAGLVAERIRAAIGQSGEGASGLRAEGIVVDASAGVATFPDDGASADDILLAADRACFVAKRDGGGRVATADEGRTLAREFTLQVPTPIDDAP